MSESKEIVPIESTTARQIRKSVTDEVFRVAGISQNSWLRKLLSPIAWPPAQRFAKIMEKFDHDVANIGIQQATREFIQRFTEKVQIHGYENIPAKGPLLVASNHPGTLDGFAILSNLPRNDIKVVVEDFAFFRSLKASTKHMILTPSELSGRVSVIKSIIRQLKAGGGVLIFPSGELDPDPAVLPGASVALEKWSPSLDFIIKQVPQTKVMLTIVSGVLDQSSVNNPITKFFDDFWMRLRVAEFIQLIQQIYFSRSYDLKMKISFGDPLTRDELMAYFDSNGVMSELISKAKQLLQSHLDEALLLPHEEESNLILSNS